MAYWFAFGGEQAVPRADDQAPSEQTEPPPTASAAAVPRPELREIVANANDFDRHSALYDHLVDADIDRVVDLLALSYALPSAPHRYDVTRVLYVRFAALDPEAAVDHVLGRAYRSSWLDAVIRAWAHADLDAAVARAALLDGHPKSVATRVLLELDLSDQARADIAKRLGAERTLAAMETREDLAADAVDFSANWEEALRVADTRQRLERLSQIATAWASEDPMAALAAAAALSTPQMSMGVQAMILRVWAAKDPTAVIEWLAGQERSFNLQFQTMTAMSAFAQRGVAEAISFLDAMPPHVRKHAEQAVVQLGMANVELGEADIDTLLNWFSTLDRNVQRELAPRLAIGLAMAHPRRALDWATSLTGEAKTTAISGVLSSLARQDPSQARRLVQEIAESDVRLAASRSIIYTQAREDPRAALEWAESFDSETERGELVGAVLSTWADLDAEAAVDELLDLRSGPVRDRAARTMAAMLVRSRVDLAERLFEAVESSAVRRMVATMLLHHFSQTDPNDEKAGFYGDVLQKLLDEQ